LRLIAPALLLSLSLAFAAGAQEATPTAPIADQPAPAEETPSDDPIGALLQDLPPDQTTDMDVEDPAPAQVLPAQPTPSLPVVIAPMTLPPPKTDPAPPPVVQTAPPPTASYARPAAPPRKPIPQLDRPVMIGEVGRAPDGPPDAVELGYESRIRSSFQAAQGLQGPLDGGWTVRAHDGAALLGFQLVDRGYGYPPEGAWRVLGGSGRVGLIDSLDRQPTILTIRITRVYGKPTTVLTLSQMSDGSWVGDLTDEAGTRPVTMRRN